jgi:hypothetical protein
MDNCFKTLLKAVNISCVLQLLNATTGETVVPLQVMQEEAVRLKQSEKLAQKDEVQN